MPFILITSDVNDGGCNIRVYDSEADVLTYLTESLHIGENKTGDVQQITLEQLNGEDWNYGDKFFVGRVQGLEIRPIVTQYELVAETRF